MTVNICELGTMFLFSVCLGLDIIVLPVFQSDGWFL